jgi:hypothetical protein
MKASINKYKKRGWRNFESTQVGSSLSMSPLTSLLGQLLFGLHKEHVVRQQQQQQH